MCELHSHVTRVFKAEGVVKPLPIVHHLKGIYKERERESESCMYDDYFVYRLCKASSVWSSRRRSRVFEVLY